MAKDPFEDSEEKVRRRQGNFSLGIARVVSVPDDGDHQVVIQPVTRTNAASDTEASTASVMAATTGSISLPSPGDLVVFGRFQSRQHVVIGTLYSQKSTIRGYAAGQRTMGHGPTDAEVTIEPDGSISISSAGGKAVTVNGAPVGQLSYTGAFLVTGTGTISVTGLPFEPRNIEFHVEAVGGQNVDRAGGGGDSVGNYAGSSHGTARADGHRQVVHSGGSGNSINETSHYSSDSECIAIRYAGQNGGKLGMLLGDVVSFDPDGFTVDITSYEQNEVVTYTAYA